MVPSVIGAEPASAHAALVRVTPGPQTALIKAPTQVVLEFDEPVSASFVTVVVTTGSGVSVARGKATVSVAKVTEALSPDLPSGAYRIAYRVVSDDGHPVTGESSFTLRLAPTARPATTAPVAASASPSSAATSPPAQAGSAGHQAAGQESWLTRHLLQVSGAFGLLVVGAVLLWNRRRR